MKVDPRNSERQRRELARKHAGEVVEASGRPLDSRRLGTMVSARLEPELVARLRRIANAQGVTLSELLRQAATVFVADIEAAPEVRLQMVWEVKSGHVEVVGSSYISSAGTVTGGTVSPSLPSSADLEEAV